MKKIIIPQNIAKDEIEISSVDFSTTPCFIVELKSNNVVGMLISNNMQPKVKPKTNKNIDIPIDSEQKQTVLRWGIISTIQKISNFNFKTPLDALSSLDKNKYSFVIDLKI